MAEVHYLLWMIIEYCMVAFFKAEHHSNQLTLDTVE